MPIDQAKRPRDDKDLNQTPSFLMPLDVFRYMLLAKRIVPKAIKPKARDRKTVLLGNWVLKTANVKIKSPTKPMAMATFCVAEKSVESGFAKERLSSSLFPFIQFLIDFYRLFEWFSHNLYKIRDQNWLRLSER